MSEMKFTKGPWWVGQQAGGDWLLQSGDPATHEPPWAVTSGTLAAIRGSEQAEANAHLIAAAPELYEALTMVQRVFAWDGSLPRPDDVPDAYELEEKISAALAKAEGR